MATFVNGSGDLGSTTFENALVETIIRAGVLDAALDTPTGNLTDDIAANGATSTLTAVCPVTLSVVSGKPTLTAVDFLSEVFDPGTGGSLSASTVSFPAAIVELASKIQALEIAQDEDVIQMIYDANASTVTVTATMAMTRTVEADGSQKFIATPYLT